MAKQNKISMPSGMGGLTRFNDDTKSAFELEPGHVVVLTIMIVILMIFLHIYF